LEFRDIDSELPVSAGRSPAELTRISSTGPRFSERCSLRPDFASQSDDHGQRAEESPLYQRATALSPNLRRRRAATIVIDN